jgi:hypothetical protein
MEVKKLYKRNASEMVHLLSTELFMIPTGRGARRAPLRKNTAILLPTETEKSSSELSFYITLKTSQGSINLL